MTESKAPRVGETFRTTRGPITTTQLVKYAGASGDFNRIHFDQAFAEESGLGGLLVHGMLTMGFAAACLSDALGPDVHVRDISARFVEPVRVGAMVESVATIRAVEADGCLAVEYESRVGERTVLLGKGVAQLVA